MSSPEQFMTRAIACAKKAESIGEVPVGAVVVRDGHVIASGYNRRECGKNALLHAEMVALARACKRVGAWRLTDCDLYVTLEPCPMCAGAIVNARIRRVFVGASDPKAGSFGTMFDLRSYPINHKPELIFGVEESICSSLLSDFFRRLREKKQKIER